MARRKRGLSEEDRALWREVVKTATPLEREAIREEMAKVEASPMSAPVAAPPPIPKPQRKLGGGMVLRPMGAARPGLSVDLAPDPSAMPERAEPGMDRRTFEKMRRGKLRPDARIDLHGMTADHAKAALAGFILGARADGARLVLVITGKGRLGVDDHAPHRKGVLRHAVPIWLRQGPMAGMVLQVTPAHRSDGGSGAYYVYLRRVR